MFSHAACRPLYSGVIVPSGPQCIDTITKLGADTFQLKHMSRLACRECNPKLYVGSQCDYLVMLQLSWYTRILLPAH